MIRRILEAIRVNELKLDPTDPFKKKPEWSNQVEDLAHEFSDVLKGWLDPAEIDEINAQNREEGYDSSICASHDHCDATQAMLDAMEQLGIEYVFAPKLDDPEFDAKLAARDKQGQLMNAAWQMAKENEFYND